MPQNTEKFVGRFERAVMQYVILNKAKEGEVTKENLRQTFTGNLQFKTDHFDECIRTLEQENHIKVDGNKIRVTDDGREDVQQVTNLAIELANVARGGTGPGQQAAGKAGTQGQTRQA